MQGRSRCWAERALFRETLREATRSMQHGQPLAVRAVEDVALGAVLKGSIVAVLLLAALKFVSAINRGNTPS